MIEKELKQRPKNFARRVLKLVDSSPDSRSGRVLVGQLGRSGTSAGANHRPAGRARSSVKMISKISVVEEEADESAFWMELTVEHGLMPTDKVAPLPQEAGELTALVVASRKTMFANNRESEIKSRK